MFELICLPAMGLCCKKVSMMAKFHLEKLFFMKFFIFHRVFHHHSSKQDGSYYAGCWDTLGFHFGCQ